MITLRSNQSEPINKAIAFFNEKKPKPSLIVLPTAWGKSILTAFVAKNCTDKLLVLQPSKELLEQRPEYQYFRLYIKGKKDPEYSFDVQEIGKLDRIVDITDQTVPDYDYGKLLEEHADSILGEYIRSMRKKEPGVCTAKALEYGVNALLGYDC